MISARVLGPVELRVDGRPPPPALLWRKHLALLIYLARSPKRGRTREHLTSVLWPDKDDPAAKHSLNEALRVLRLALGDAGLETGAGQVHLSPGAVRLDTDEMEQAINGERWREACDTVAGEFLEGFGVPGCDRLEDWLATERRWWTGRSLVALTGGSEAALREGDAALALSLAERGLALAPHSDSAVQAAMRALAVQGEVGVAEARYQAFAEAVGRELGGAPSPATQALAERLRTIRGRPARGGGAATPGPDRTRPPLTGRQRELQQMVSLWEGCRRGAATLLVMDGEPGVGKSRLLAELAERVTLDGDPVVLTRAVAGDEAAAGSGLLCLARGGLLCAPGLAAAPATALAAFASRLAEWAEQFPGAASLAPVPVPQAVAALLDAILAEGPLLLVVDDAQWVDTESLHALTAALRDHPAAPLMVVLAATPHPPRPELDEIRRRAGPDLPGLVLALAPLDGEAIRRLAAWAMPGYDAVALERLARRTASDSAGLPFLAVELLSAVAQGLDLHQGTAAWPVPFHTLTQTLPGDLPDSAVAALRISFRRLSAVAQRVLAAAAVLGDRVDGPQLAAALDIAPAALAGALDELEWQRWLEADGRGYGFVARLARLIIERDMVTPGQRARLLERAPPTSTPTSPPSRPA